MSDYLEQWHKQQYENALRWADQIGPKWEELTEEQRMAIRGENSAYRRHMDRLGAQIAAGNKRPLMHLPRGVTEPCEDCDPVYGCTMNCSGPVTLTPRAPEPPPKRGKKK